MGRPETPERLRQIRARRQGGVFKVSAADDFVDFTVDEPTRIFTPAPKGSKKQMYQNRSNRQSTGDGMYTDDGSVRQSRPGSGRSRVESPVGGSRVAQDSRMPSPDHPSRLTTGQSRRAPTTAQTENSRRSENRTAQSPQHHESISSVRSSREAQSPPSRGSMHPSLTSHFPSRKGGLMVDYDIDEDEDEDEDEESDEDGSFSARTARASVSEMAMPMPRGQCCVGL